MKTGQATFEANFKIDELNKKMVETLINILKHNLASTRKQIRIRIERE